MMDHRQADGMVLVVALLAMLLMSALGAGLILITSLETIVAANFRNNREAVHAVDAAAERALTDVALVADFDQLLNGSARSSFVDGLPSGPRMLPDGSIVDLSQVVNLASCHKTTTCSSAEMDAVTVDRPWGANNPRWQLYAYGRLKDVLPNGAVDSPYYAVVLVGDDPSENDGDPRHDGAGPGNPGAGVLALRAEVFGSRSAHKVVELTIARTSRGGIRALSWRALR
jgi:hypothetical protein